MNLLGVVPWKRVLLQFNQCLNSLRGLTGPGCDWLEICLVVFNPLDVPAWLQQLESILHHLVQLISGNCDEQPEMNYIILPD